MRRVLLVAMLTALLAGLAAGTTLSAFTSETDNSSNVVTAADDFRAPTISAEVVGKSTGGTTGYIKQGASYYVYANVTDTGNPASGIASVSADVSNLTTGATSVALVAGSYSAGGTSYNYRSALQTANGTLSEGAKSFTVSSSDNASNSGSQTGSVTVDNTPPTASDVQAANGGSTVGEAEQSDTVTYTFSEPIDPESVLAGWDGSATNVVVRMRFGSILAGNDDLRVFNSSNTTQLPLGVIDLGRTDYVTGLVSGELRFGASGTASTMALSGSTITITLGNRTTVSGGSAGTAGGNGTMSWAPSGTPTDRAGNASSTGAANEGGAGDKEF
jgi:hypothetical protein